jgi:hypothetical protein
MALSHVTAVYAMNDAKVYKMLTDPAGAPTTYATGVDVPGMKSVAITRIYNSHELRGDNQLMAVESILERITIKVAHGKLGFDVDNVLTGGTIADTGTTPNQKTAYKILPSDVPNFWKLEAQCVSADPVGGDFHLIVYKAKVSNNLDLGMAEEDFQLFGFEAVCAPTIGTPLSWLDLVENETKVAVV